MTARVIRWHEGKVSWEWSRPQSCKPRVHSAGSTESQKNERGGLIFRKSNRDFPRIQSPLECACLDGNSSHYRSADWPDYQIQIRRQRYVALRANSRTARPTPEQGIWSVQFGASQGNLGSRFSENAAKPSIAAEVVQAVAIAAAPLTKCVNSDSPIISFKSRFVI